MHIFSDPSVWQVTLMLMILIGVAVYVRQFKTIAGLIVVYIAFISFFTPKEIPHSIQNIPAQTIQNQIEEISDTLPMIEGEKAKDSSIISLPNITNDMQNVPDIGSDVFIQTMEITKTDTLSNIFIIQKMETCSNVVSQTRHPVGVATEFPDTIDQVYCFTMVQNLGKTQSVKHEWSFNGTVISTIPMEIGRSHYWRAWSYQTIQPKNTGDWSVSISDSNGVTLRSIDFSIYSTKTDETQSE
ncbi:MAG: DUF2914 domain-containing protein [Candidatus Marinimicrobia bacterium]|jgi:hypothetical protein|nr:DUF2914 domain-containing protein [Candidatus Neomarinimicrobiota bacterium]MBT4569593.1 DUF2914 domain-containing protein [Candidatus Neomarinimicrobiota bacterium]MBT6196516.1 DUF2914 domain-containing protein [Candidatus Neomarinimicrobiota bacterium]MBT6930083.1 DUF2914 domain-containing protein [Candidatus Neomarinimicrobiota bacterium]